jgi:hypothetical protein
MAKKVTINRAAVLTLWATIVAERLGHSKQEALTLGRAVAGLNAQSKGQRIGIYAKKTEEEKEKERKEAKESKLPTVAILGRSVPVVKTAHGLRAALEHLAKAYTPRELEARAYDLYEKFRPEIPEGKKGWGAKGELDLDYVRSLAK